jgi:hypothetical protein
MRSEKKQTMRRYIAETKAQELSAPSSTACVE